MDTQSSIILFVQGGAGDVLAQTPMIRCMRQTYPDDKIVVLSTYSQLLENNPNIDVLISLKDPKDFYSEYVLDQNVRFFKKRFLYDYIMDDWASGTKNLIEFACNCYGVKWDGAGPELYLTEYEKRATKTFMSQTNKKKVLLHVYCAVPSDGGHQVLMCDLCKGTGKIPDGSVCQKCGGSGKIVIRQKTNGLKDIDPQILAPIIEKHKNKVDFLQIGLEGEPIVPGAVDCLGMPMREAIALIDQCDSFIFAESLFAHCAGALKKPGIVIFQNTDPEFFGYPTAFNLSDANGCTLWPCNRPVGALLDMLAGYKNPKTRERMLWECPDQKCAKISTKIVEEALIKSLNNESPRPSGDNGFSTLESARRG